MKWFEREETMQVRNESCRTPFTFPSILSMRAFSLFWLCGIVLMSTSVDVLAVTLQPTIDSLEEVNQLLDEQNQQLKEMQKNAQDVLFFSNGEPKDKTGYCKRFWQALKTQDKFYIPKPVMLANTKEEKVNLFTSLNNYAKSNFNRYLSQEGKLTPKTYKDVEGTVRGLVPYRKGGFNSLKDLPNKFEKSWLLNPFSILGTRGLFEESVTTHLLYLPPYLVAGYQHPVVISLFKDQCEHCTGLSIGLRNVSVDGLLHPEFGNGEMFSQHGYIEAMAKFEIHNQTKLVPNPPYLLMGMGTFNRQFIFWAIQEKTWSVPLRTDVGGYYKPEDATEYFRRYMLDLRVLESPRYHGPEHACSVAFN